MLLCFHCLIKTIPHLPARQRPDDILMHCPVSGISNDVLELIFDIATYDTTWDDHPRPTPGCSSSPLAVAINISHVCRKWRSDILGIGYLWGRLLNTSYFPTYNNLLWKQVYLRSGERSPLWLRHINRTPTNMATRHLTQCQMYQFIHMFLLVIINVSVYRIQRLELNIWHRELLCNLPATVKARIREAVACHTTHLRLGNVDFNDRCALGERPRGTNGQTRSLQQEHAYVTSLMLLELAFGDESFRSVQNNGRSLRKLGIYGVDIWIEDLLGILRTTPVLEELHLEACAHRYTGRTGFKSRRYIAPPCDIIILPFLRKLRVCRMFEMLVGLLPVTTACQMEVCCLDIGAQIPDNVV